MHNDKSGSGTARAASPSVDRPRTGYETAARRAGTLALGVLLGLSLSSCEAINHDLLGDRFSPTTNKVFDPADIVPKHCTAPRDARALKPLERAPEYALESICDDTDGKLLVIFAFSGGGFRSAAFGFGALLAANEIRVGTTHYADEKPGTLGRPLTKEIDIVSGVSGGAFTAAAFASRREHLFGDEDSDSPYAKHYLTHNFMGDLLAIYLEPWRWGWLLPDFGSNDEMADMYGRVPLESKSDHLFAEDFNSLANMGRPFLVIQATDFGNEQPFTFTQNDFDLICSDVNKYPLRNAIAAANGFPVLFSPITLFNFRFRDSETIPAAARERCGPDHPEWTDLGNLVPVELSPEHERAVVGQSYISPDDPAYPPRSVHLQDGGVVDNLALRGLMNIMTQALGSNEIVETKPATASGGAELSLIGPPAAGALHACEAGLDQVQRILVISVDGEAEPDNSVSSLPYLSDIGLIFNVLSSSVIDSNDYQTLFAAQAMTLELKNRLEQLAACGHPPQHNIAASFAHVSFHDLNAQYEMTFRNLGRDPEKGSTIDQPDQRACGRSNARRDPAHRCTIGLIAHSGTSLHFSTYEVDALVKAGHDAFLCDLKLRQIFWPRSGKAYLQGAADNGKIAAGWATDDAWPGLNLGDCAISTVQVTPRRSIAPPVNTNRNTEFLHGH